jgi:hypothetical protein
VVGTPFEEWNRVAPGRERQRSTVEEQVQLLVDKDRIRSMIDEYGLCCDSANWDKLAAELYDENIERELAGTLRETVHGRAELINAHSNAQLRRAEGIDTKKVDLQRFQNREVRHLISTRQVRISDDNQAAWALAYYQMAVSGRDDEGWKRGEHEGTYVFCFSKETGDWRFTRHIVWSNNALNPMFAEPVDASTQKLS